MMRFKAVLMLAAFFTCQTDAADAVDIGQLQQAYAANNKDDLPLVSWMNWGRAQFLLYEDGEVLVLSRESKSKVAHAHLSAAELNAALKTLSAQDGFWQLSPRYTVTNASDRPSNAIAVRIPGRAAITVTVYGNLNQQLPGDKAPPAAFMQFIDALKAITPARMEPWDPGYVEIMWTGYGNADDESLPWPGEWPSLDGPLTRPVTYAVIQKMMIFPSSQLTELDAFLARRPQRGYILIDGRKMSGHYRWPLRNEKKWSTWTQ